MKKLITRDKSTYHTKARKETSFEENFDLTAEVCVCVLLFPPQMFVFLRRLLNHLLEIDASFVAESAQAASFGKKTNRRRKSKRAKKGNERYLNAEL